MRRAFTFLALLILTASLAAAVPIEEDTFSVHEYIGEDEDEVVYEATPAPDRIIEVSITGSNGYAPLLRIYQDDALVPMETLTAPRGRTDSATFTSPDERMTPSTYRFVIVTADGLAGADYTFSYSSQEQDDAGSGMDAPERFDSAIPLGTGTYDGFLGGSDQMDFYELSLSNQETVTFELTAQEKGTLGLVLTDSQLFKKVDTSRFLDPATGDATLTTSFLSLRDQDVTINVKGDVPYELVVTSDRVAEAAEEDELQTPPSPPETPPSQDGTESGPEPEEEAGSSLLVVLLVIVILAGAGVLGFLSWKGRGSSQKKASEKKKASKKRKK